MPQFESFGLKGGVWRGYLSARKGAPSRVVLVQHGAGLGRSGLTGTGVMRRKEEGERIARGLCSSGVRSRLDPAFQYPLQLVWKVPPRQCNSRAVKTLIDLAINGQGPLCDLV